MVARREFLKTGGLVLAGLTAPPFVARLAWPRGEVAEIYMRSDPTGGEVWFDPVGIVIEPGQTVRWIAGNNVHTTTAYHPQNGGRQLRIPRTAEPWDSGYLLKPDEYFEVTLYEEGVYDYFCIPHEAAGMVGRIVVGDPKASPPPPYDESVPLAAQRALPPLDRLLTERVLRR